MKNKENNKKYLFIILALSIVFLLIKINSPSLVVPRSRHSAFLLNNDKVIFVGGDNNNAGNCNGKTISAEVFDIRSKRSHILTYLNEYRWDGETITLLKNNKILITGGRDCNNGYSKTAEILDPETGKSEYTSSMHFARTDHSATLLKDGRVLIAGGFYATNVPATYPEEAEIYDPKTEEFTITAKMPYSINRHGAILLNDGNVLLVGGGILGETDYTSKAEIYDLKINKFYPAGNLNINRGYPNLLLLKDGNVLIVGGTNRQHYIKQAEIYNTKTKTFQLAGNLTNKIYGFTSSLRQDGNILIAGGRTGFGTSTKTLADIELYNPKLKSFKEYKQMKVARTSHTATLLPNGILLITGGINNHNDLKNIELISYK
jgi:N-acetylneuraminic acid mutarotase